MKRFPFAPLLLLLSLLSACQFGAGTVICEDGTGPQFPVPTTIRELQTQLGAARQTFTYTPGQTNSFVGSQRTVVTIPGDAFVRNGRPLTAPIQLTLREIYRRADMVLTNTPTVAYGVALESAGEVFLRAEQDTAVRMSPGAVIQMQTQNPPNLVSRDSMQLFVSGPAGGTCFSWYLNPDFGSGMTPTPTGNIISIRSTLYNSGIGWFNCDRFYYAPSVLPIVVNVPGANIDPTTNTSAFAVFRDFNGAVAVCDFTPPNTFRADQMPQGARVSVVVLRTIDNKLYYGRQDGTLQAGAPFTPALTEISVADLLTELNTL